MNTKPTLTLLAIIFILAACGTKPSASTLSPREQAYAQTQFVQQAATSAAAYARTAQQDSSPASPNMASATFAIIGSQTPLSPLASLTPAQPANTLPPAQTQAVPSGTSTRAANPSATSALNPSATPTRTPAASATSAPTATSTQATGWQGEWIINFQKNDGAYVSGTIIVALNGEELNAEGTLNGIPYQFNGRVVNDGLRAFGSWSNTQTSGSFTWTLVQTNQFGGDRDLMYGVCGARPGAQFPEPCYIPPIS